MLCLIGAHICVSVIPHSEVGPVLEQHHQAAEDGTSQPQLIQRHWFLCQVLLASNVMTELHGIDPLSLQPCIQNLWDQMPCSLIRMGLTRLQVGVALNHLQSCESSISSTALTKHYSCDLNHSLYTLLKSLARLKVSFGLEWEKSLFEPDFSKSLHVMLIAK